MTVNDKKLRVLLVAEAANPEFTSVPLVGWSHCQALLRVVDGHVVTQVRNRDAIKRAGWVEGREFTAIDSEAVARRIHEFAVGIGKLVNVGWTAGTALSALSYYYFEHLLWQQFGPRIRAGEFDIVHRVTPLSPVVPSIIAARCRAANVPFVWGPINGGVDWPKGYGDLQRQEGEWLSYVRDAYKLLPGHRATLDQASCIIAGSEATRAKLPQRVLHKCVYIPENAVDPSRFPTNEVRRSRDKLRVAFVGRLTPYKGAHMLIEAAEPLIREGRVELDIIGDGPQMPALREMADRLDLKDGLTFSGWIAHDKVQERLGRAHVFGFPSIREFGGAVVLEAMALGVAPVVVDYAGPRELVGPTSGLRIPLGTPEELVSRFRSALAQLADDPERAERMGKAGRERVLSLFTWDAKAAQVHAVYRWVLGQGSKPDYGMPFIDVAAAASAEPQSLGNV